MKFRPGNVEFQPRKATYHHDESVSVKNPELVQRISSLLSVQEETLLQALTSKKARASGETLVIAYKFPEVTCLLQPHDSFIFSSQEHNLSSSRF
jgi:myosin heavy subunit